MSPSSVNRHLVGALLLQILSGALGNDVLVGEEFVFTCGGREGYWRLNGSLTGQMGASYSETATEHLDGLFTCTNSEGTVTYSSVTLRVFGLLGVSPSPSNCSSTNTTTNTCTVSAAINSSLTLCANFTRYPENASRHAELSNIMWKRISPSEETLLQCYDSHCTGSSTPVGYSFREDWGRCLHVDNVEENSVFSYSIVEVFPPRQYPSGFVHTEVLFSMQVGPSPTPSPTSTTTEKPTPPISVGPSSTSVSSELISSSAVVTPSTGPVRVTPPPPVEVGIVVGVVITAFVILTAVVVVITVAVVIFKKRRQAYRLQKLSESIIDPESQQQSTNEGKQRPSDLQIERQFSATSPSTYPSITTPSSQRPLLHPEQDGPPSSIGLPSYNTAMNHTNGHAPLPHPQPQVVPNGTAPHVYYSAPGNHQPQDNSASNRHSLCQDMPGFDSSPEVLVF